MLIRRVRPKKRRGIAAEANGDADFLFAVHMVRGFVLHTRRHTKRRRKIFEVSNCSGTINSTPTQQ